MESAIVGSARGKRSAEATDQIKGLPDTADRTPRRYPQLSGLRNSRACRGFVVSTSRVTGETPAAQLAAMPSIHFVRNRFTSVSSSSEMLCVSPVYTRPDSSECVGSHWAV